MFSRYFKVNNTAINPNADFTASWVIDLIHEDEPTKINITPGIIRDSRIRSISGKSLVIDIPCKRLCEPLVSTFGERIFMEESIDVQCYANKHFERPEAAYVQAQFFGSIPFLDFPCTKPYVNPSFISVSTMEEELRPFITYATVPPSKKHLCIPTICRREFERLTDDSILKMARRKNLNSLWELITELQNIADNETLTSLLAVSKFLREKGGDERVSTE